MSIFWLGLGVVLGIGAILCGCFYAILYDLDLKRFR